MSLFPYIGEKASLSKFIISEIPFDIKTYVEPFGGSFGLYSSLDLNNFENVNFIYNDINYLNYNLMLKLKDDNFIELVKNTNVDENLYKESLNNLYYDDSALSWLIVLCCSSLTEIGKYSWIGDKKFELFKIKIKFNRKHLHRINNFHNLDYRDIIDMYDSNDTLFYLDPPYKGKEEFYINHNFNLDSHRELSEVLNKIKGKFILSYYFFDGLSELYPNCRFKSKKTIGTEWIIMNF